MEIKKKNAHETLLDARKEGLARAEKQSLRPLGKCWGVDVFAWANPSIPELAATIEYFPFPIVWLGNASAIQKMAEERPLLIQTLQWLAQYDSALFPLNRELTKTIPLVSATQNLEEAFELLKGNRQLKTILVFTTHGSGWEKELDNFEELVKRNK
jgi:hypothetical protein